MITNNKSWNEKAINKRATWIINYLLQEVLTIPKAMRRTNNFRMKKGNYLSFFELQIIGEDINFIGDSSIVAHVVGDKEVEFEGKKWRLSPLTKEIKKRQGSAISESTSYQGAQYWEYDGMRLSEIM